MKTLGLAGLVFILVGCAESKTSDVSENYVLPQELSDCHVYHMRSERSRDLTVIRCPDSDTVTRYSVTSGKTTKQYNNEVLNDH